jgi:hypothetical protein
VSLFPWRSPFRERPGPWALARLVSALVAFLPFAPGLLQGGSFYFRDLLSHFFPIRRYVVEGLRAGEIRLFNPYVNEGVPLSLPPVAYPVDLLQVLLPGEWGFSLLLALHVPLAAVLFVGLARRLGYHPAAATLGALAFSLSGFALSSVNLYLMVQALAWAPLVVSLLLRAGSGTARDTALAAVAVAACVSTLGLEIAAQAIGCGLVLAASRGLASLARQAGGVLLGLALAAFPLQAFVLLFRGSRREQGFSLFESLDQSVHPLSLVQAVVAGLYGDPVASGYSYWGARFWGGPSPYFLSLYLGGAVLCFAAIGATRAGRPRARLLLLLALGLLVSLGRFAGLQHLLELVPALATLRFPVKAFFTVVLATSLLAAAGADALLRSKRAFTPLLALATAAGAALAALPLVEAVFPRAFGAVRASLFVASYPDELRTAALRAVAADAAAGAVPILAIAGLAALVRRERLSAQAAVLAAAALVAADLLRAGTGLNPTVDASLFAFSPETTRVVERLRGAGGSAFTCTPQAMPTFREAARQRKRTDVWSAAVWRETLSPHANMDAGIRVSAWDATGGAAQGHGLSEADAMCRDPETLPRLRARGVRHVLSVQPFTNEELRLVETAAPPRIAPLAVHVYELRDSLPDPAVWTTPDDADADGRGHVLAGASARYLEGAWDLVRVAVETKDAARVIVRRAARPGWSAIVDGRPADIEVANGRHQAVRVPAGRSEVALRYHPPSLWAGGLLSLLAAAVAATLWRRPSRP